MESQGGDFSMAGAGSKAFRLPPRKLSPFPDSLLIPADVSDAQRPNPRATQDGMVRRREKWEE